MSTTDQQIEQQVTEIGRKARQASKEMAKASTRQKNQALITLANLIHEQRTQLKTANNADLARAKSAGNDAAFIDRLTLSDRAIDTMMDGLKQIASLSDPIGEIGEMRTQPSGISVGKMLSLYTRLTLPTICSV